LCWGYVRRNVFHHPFNYKRLLDLRKILVRAIGRKASTGGNGTIFGMGQISYAFQILGNYFVENELFMILHITGPKRSGADFIIFRGGF
jgi:hypothetical protein